MPAMKLSGRDRSNLLSGFNLLSLTLGGRPLEGWPKRSTDIAHGYP